MTSEEKRQKAQINRLMAKGPIDLPFALLVLLLTAIGVLMVFSASFARAFYEAEDPSAMAALSAYTGRSSAKTLLESDPPQE